MGTPSEFNFFKDCVAPYITNERKLILCSDHSGFQKKQAIINYIKEKNKNTYLESPLFYYVDVGCYSDRDCDYTEFVNSAVEVQKSNPGSLIIACCRSGQGVSIAGNKNKGVRGVVVHNSTSAKLGIEHNAANFFAVSAEYFKDEDIENLLENLLNTNFV